MVRESGYLGIRQKAKLVLGNVELRFQPSLACGDEQEWLLLSWQKYYSLILNLLVFHSYSVTPGADWGELCLKPDACFVSHAAALFLLC